MTASFPTSLKTFLSKTDYADIIYAEHVNSLQDEVAAIESGLGVNYANIVHLGTSDQFSALTFKEFPAGADRFVIEDSTDSFSKKYTNFNNVPAYGIPLNESYGSIGFPYLLVLSSDIQFDLKEASAWLQTMISEIQAIFLPASLTVNTGTQDSDSASSDLTDVGGVTVQIAEAAPAGSNVVVGFTSISVYDPNTLIIHGNYDGGTTHQTLVQVYNYSSSDYDTVGTMAHSSDMQWYVFPMFSADNYNLSGAASVRFLHSGTGIAGHTLKLDYVALQYSISPSSSITLDHGQLGGLSDDDHPQYALDNTNMNYYVDGTLGSDGNDGLTSDTAFATIAAGLNKVRGQGAAYSTTIYVAAGTYDEQMILQGFAADTANLTIAGDTRNICGQMYMHGGAIGASIGAGGLGAVTLATDNSGTGGRARVTVTCATTNPNFDTDGWGNGDQVAIYNGTTLTEYTIYSVSTNVITLTSTATAPSLNTNGRYICFLPNRRIEPSGTSSFCIRLTSLRCNVVGFLCKSGSSTSSQYCVYVENGGFLSPYKCVLWAQHANRAGIQLTTNCGIYTGSWPNTFIGGIAGVYLATPGSCFNINYTHLGGGTYGVYAAYNSAGECQLCNFSSNISNTGVYALSQAFIHAGSTSTRNYASTTYSPATSNTEGNNGAMITWT